jgi:sigma-B regulation protein RsbU (phosphoserine phosphatase)
LSVAGKILAAFLGVALVALTAAGYLAVNQLSNLGDEALTGVTLLGRQAVDDAGKTLLDGSSEELKRRARNQAAIADTFFQRIEGEVAVLATGAAALWNTPLPPVLYPSAWEQVKPTDPFAVSAWAAAPGVDTALRRDELARLANLDDLFRPIARSDQNVTWVYIGTGSGLFRVYPWSGVPETYDPRDRPWYVRAVKEGKPGWTDPYVDAAGKGLMITCSAPVRGPGGAIMGVVAADVGLEVISRDIIGTQVGKTGYAFLTGTDGKVLARPGLTQGDLRWDETYRTESLLLSENYELKQVGLAMAFGLSGVQRCQLEDSDKFIAFAPIPSTGWEVGIVLPVDEILAPAHTTGAGIERTTDAIREKVIRQRDDTRGVFILVFVVLLAAVAVIAWLLSRRISRPILALNTGARAIGTGNLDYHFSIRTGDEIEDLAGAFNKMTADLKQRLRELQETTSAKERIESELRVANEIQTTMLPRLFPPFPDRKEIDIYATMKPAREVGGDLYDFFFTGPDHLCLVVGDVCGKGIPAALFMAISRTLIKTEAQRGLSPGEVLAHVNDTLAPDNDASMFLTVFCALLNVRTGELVVASGGHNPPLLSNRGGFDFMGVPKGVPVGPVEGSRYPEKIFHLTPGESLFIYTDGVTEAADRLNLLYSEQRLQTRLGQLAGGDSTALIRGVMADLETFTAGAEQSDDITMLAVRYLGRQAV